MSPSINFTQIKNELLHNPAISYKAKGLLCLLLSNQSGKWTSYQQTLQRFSREGSDAIRSGLKELEVAGYLLRLRYVDCTTKQLRGAFWAYTDTAWEFVMNTQLQFLTNNNLEVQGKPGEELKSYIENQKKLLDFPQLGNPILGNPILGNQSLIILKDNNTKIKEDIIRQNSEKETSQNKSIDRILQLYNKYCPSLCKATKLSLKRKKAISARLNNYSIQDLKRAFQMAEASDFLTGRSKNSTWRCPGFDWLLNENNLLKILEGNYNNHGAAATNDKASSSTNSSSEITVDDFLESTFKSKDTRNIFTNTCLKPAQHYFNQADPIELAEALVDIYKGIERTQKENLPEDMRRLMPGPMGILSSYLEWLADQDWIMDHSLSLLSLSGKPFGKFRRQWARDVDNMERDAITGKSYMREE